MAYVGTTMTIRIGSTLPTASFARYLKEWSRAVEGRPETASVFAMYDIPEWPGMTAVDRRQWSDMLKSHERILRRTTAGMVLAAPSRLTRGAARAIFWLAPPPYPYESVDAPRAAFDHIAERGGAPGAVATRAYETLVRRHWQEPRSG
jgi:hypothetical protein